MEKFVMLLFALIVGAGFLLAPMISHAAPDNGNPNAGGNGNHYCWDKDKGKHYGRDNQSRDDGPVSIPEPATLLFLASGIAGVGLAG